MGWTLSSGLCRTQSDVAALFGVFSSRSSAQALGIDFEQFKIGPKVGTFPGIAFVRRRIGDPTGMVHQPQRSKRSKTRGIDQAATTIAWRILMATFLAGPITNPDVSSHSRDPMVTVWRCSKGSIDILRSHLGATERRSGGRASTDETRQPAGPCRTAEVGGSKGINPPSVELGQQ